MEHGKCEVKHLESSLLRNAQHDRSGVHEMMLNAHERRPASDQRYMRHTLLVVM